MEAPDLVHEITGICSQLLSSVVTHWQKGAEILMIEEYRDSKFLQGKTMPEVSMLEKKVGRKAKA